MKSNLQTTVFLVRHGQTDRVYSTDPKIDSRRRLNDLGELQMDQVGRYLADFDIANIYSSPLQRTQDSAEIIRKAVKFIDQVVVKPELAEVYSQTDYQRVDDRMPKLLLEIVGRDAGRHIVVVSHQDVIQETLNCYDLTDEEKDFPCQMADVYRLVFAGEQLVETTKLRPTNATS